MYAHACPRKERERAHRARLMDLIGAVTIVVLAIVIAIYLKRNTRQLAPTPEPKSELSFNKAKLPFPACKVSTFFCFNV